MDGPRLVLYKLGGNIPTPLSHYLIVHCSINWQRGLKWKTSFLIYTNVEAHASLSMFFKIFFQEVHYAIKLYYY